MGGPLGVISCGGSYEPHSFLSSTQNPKGYEPQSCLPVHYCAMQTQSTRLHSQTSRKPWSSSPNLLFCSVPMNSIFGLITRTYKEVGYGSPTVFSIPWRACFWRQSVVESAVAHFGSVSAGRLRRDRCSEPTLHGKVFIYGLRVWDRTVAKTGRQANTGALMFRTECWVCCSIMSRMIKTYFTVNPEL